MSQPSFRQPESAQARFIFDAPPRGLNPTGQAFDSNTSAVNFHVGFQRPGTYNVALKMDMSADIRLSTESKPLTPQVYLQPPQGYYPTPGPAYVPNWNEPSVNQQMNERFMKTPHDGNTHPLYWLP